MFAENLKRLRKENGKTQEQLATAMEINRSTLADYERGIYEPSIQRLQTFARYFGVTVDELLNGPKPPRKPSLGDQRIRVLAITTDTEERENIEFVPQQARAGYLEGYADPQFIANLPHFRLPGTPVGTFRAFEIKGDSMPPINEGFIVIGRYVEDWQDLKDDKRYILVTQSDGIVFKRITNRVQEQEKLVLSSDNPQYAPYELSITEVMEAWSFHAFIGFPENYLWSPADQIMNKLDHLESKLDRLQQ